MFENLRSLTYEKLIAELVKPNADPNALGFAHAGVLRHFGTLNAQGVALDEAQQAILSSLIQTMGEDEALKYVAQGAATHNDDTLQLHEND